MLDCASESPGGFVKPQIAGPILRGSDSADPGGARKVAFPYFLMFIYLPSRVLAATWGICVVTRRIFPTWRVDYSCSTWATVVSPWGLSCSTARGILVPRLGIEH